MEISPEEEFLVELFYVVLGKLIFFYDTAQFVILLTAAVYVGNQLRILQVVAVFVDKAAVDVGTPQGMTHF